MHVTWQVLQTRAALGASRAHRRRSEWHRGYDRHGDDRRGDDRRGTLHGRKTAVPPVGTSRVLITVH